jgi:hypothetical protein
VPEDEAACGVCDEGVGDNYFKHAIYSVQNPLKAAEHQIFNQHGTRKDHHRDRVVGTAHQTTG